MMSRFLLVFPCEGKAYDGRRKSKIFLSRLCSRRYEAPQIRQMMATFSLGEFARGICRTLRLVRL